MKKVLITLVVLAIAGTGIFFYVTRPAGAPTQDVSSVVADSTAGQAQGPGTTYEVDPTQSSASFTLGETLHGSHFMPVGTTNQVAGEITISTSTDPSAAPQITFSKLAVNAKTFKTDSTQRDGAIARFILKTTEPENELITFVPNPATNVVQNSDGTFAFNLTGTLTISGVTKEETFAITGKLAGDTFTGKATMTVSRADFNLQIPNISFVANVDDKVMATVNFVAKVAVPKAAPVQTEQTEQRGS